jgi:hypothetical protein
MTEYPELQAGIEASNLREIKELCEGEETRELIDGMADDLQKQAEREREKIEAYYDLLLRKHELERQPYKPGGLHVKASALKPRRLFKGPLSNAMEKIREELGEERAGWYDRYQTSPMRRLGSDAFEIVNLMDGERTLLEIRHIVSLEFNETSLEFVYHYTDDLKEMGLITYS